MFGEIVELRVGQDHLDQAESNIELAVARAARDLGEGLERLLAGGIVVVGQGLDRRRNGARRARQDGILSVVEREQFLEEVRDLIRLEDGDDLLGHHRVVAEHAVDRLDDVVATVEDRFEARVARVGRLDGFLARTVARLVERDARHFVVELALRGALAEHAIDVAAYGVFCRATARKDPNIFGT